MLDNLQCSDIYEDMWAAIDKIITDNKAVSGALITVLRECQNLVGYLPVELLTRIGTGLNLPLSEVYSVASFYSVFSLKPKGRHVIKVCLGTACYVKGIKEVLSCIDREYRLKEGDTTKDRRFSLESVRCLGSCGLAPVMVIDNDIYGHIKSDKIKEIFEKYK